MIDFQEVDNPLFHLPANSHFLPAGRPEINQRTEQSALHVHMGAKLDGVEYGHTPEQGYILEGSGKAKGGSLRRLDTARQLLAMVANGALLRFVKAGDAVKKRGLARTVRADNGRDGVFRHLETDILQRLDATK